MTSPCSVSSPLKSSQHSFCSSGGKHCLKAKDKDFFLGERHCLNLSHHKQVLSPHTENDQILLQLEEHKSIFFLWRRLFLCLFFLKEAIPVLFPGHASGTADFDRNWVIFAKLVLPPKWVSETTLFSVTILCQVDGRAPTTHIPVSGPVLRYFTRCRVIKLSTQENISSLFGLGTSWLAYRRSSEGAGTHATIATDVQGQGTTTILRMLHTSQHRESRTQGHSQYITKVVFSNLNCPNQIRSLASTSFYYKAVWFAF